MAKIISAVGARLKTKTARNNYVPKQTQKHIRKIMRAIHRACRQGDMYIWYYPRRIHADDEVYEIIINRLSDELKAYGYRVQHSRIKDAMRIAWSEKEGC